MKINLIYAKSQNNVIGDNGKLPWHIPEDLAYFNTMTRGAPVIMGSRTWQSLPSRFKPLPGRFNAVLTTNPSLAPEIIARDTVVFCDQEWVRIENVIRYFKDTRRHQQIWVIGGSSIYKQALPYAHHAYVTEVHADASGDTYAPFLDSNWVEAKRKKEITKSGIDISFVVYDNQYPVSIDRTHVD